MEDIEGAGAALLAWKVIDAMFGRRSSEIVLGFLWASIFWSAILGWQAAYTPTEAQKQECYETAKREGHKNEECETFWARTTRDPVAFFTFALTLSTIGLWVVTFVGIRNQSRDTEILQRAYLSVEPGGIEPPFDRGDRVLGKAICRNVGHLPARNLHWFTCMQSGLTDFETFPIGEMEKGHGVLSPGTQMVVSTGTLFTEHLSNAIFVWGMVTYDDGFGNRRYTKFCHRYFSKHVLGEGIFEIPVELAQIYMRGNDAD